MKDIGSNAPAHFKRGFLLMESAISLTLIGGFLLAWVANINHQADQLLKDRYQYETNQHLLEQVAGHTEHNTDSITVEGDEHHAAIQLEVVGRE
ncbi:MAG: hypothetical protein Q4A67_03965 [Aerococcus sp.]|nr:hypothetical protein [Aerococcus sp.]